jgi:hypothetical protein
MRQAKSVLSSLIVESGQLHSSRRCRPMELSSLSFIQQLQSFRTSTHLGNHSPRHGIRIAQAEAIGCINGSTQHFEIRDSDHNMSGVAIQPVGALSDSNLSGIDQVLSVPVIACHPCSSCFASSDCSSTESDSSNSSSSSSPSPPSPPAPPLHTQGNMVFNHEHRTPLIGAFNHRVQF